MKFRIGVPPFKLIVKVCADIEHLYVISLQIESHFKTVTDYGYARLKKNSVIAGICFRVGLIGVVNHIGCSAITATAVTLK